MLPRTTVFVMSSSPAARVLVILALLAASEVSSAPREELIKQDLKQETLRETREAQVLEHHTESESSGHSREYEIRHRPVRLVKEPLPSVREGEVNATKKPNTVDEEKGTLETKDMTESLVPARVNEDSAKSNETLTASKDDNEKNDGDDKNKKVGSVEEPESKNPAGKTTNFPENLPEVFPPNVVRTIDNEQQDVVRKFNHYSHSEDATANKTNVTKLPTDGTDITTVTIVPTSPTNLSSTTVVTSEATIATPTTQTTRPSVPATIPSSTTNKPVATTESSPKSEVVTESTILTIVSTEPSKAELQLHSKKVEPMPSGIVALITAIAFAIVAVLAYVGLVVWRRCLEWRYGNRELLVNDFDANDIGNFEL